MYYLNVVQSILETNKLFNLKCNQLLDLKALIYFKIKF